MGDVSLLLRILAGPQEVHAELPREGDPSLSFFIQMAMKSATSTGDTHDYPLLPLIRHSHAESVKSNLRRLQR